MRTSYGQIRIRAPLSKVAAPARPGLPPPAGNLYCAAEMRGNCFLRPNVCAIVLIFLFVGAGGCVRRTLTVTTDPPGAVIYLNGVEAGRTPLERDFVFYGTYDVAVRKEGYETLKTKG